MSKSKGRNIMGQRALLYAPSLCCILLLVISSSPNVLAEDEEGVISERSPVYQSGFQPVHISPQDAAHLRRNLAHQQPRAPTYYRKSNAPSSESQELDADGKPKSYAFAYAVKDGENGDDFSHKERREGKKTIGEYSVLLPDGRTQVVRYTSDAKEGFKADVTYEGGSGHLSQQAGSQQHTKTTPRYQPASSVASAPQQQISSPFSESVAYNTRGPTVPSYEASLPRATPSRAGPEEIQGPIYLSYPLKARRPSVSPQYYYKSSRDQSAQPEQYLAASPTPVVYRESPRPRQYKAKVRSQASYPGPSQITYLSPSPTPYPGPSPSAYPAGPSPSAYTLAGPSPTPYSRNSYHKASPTPGSYKYYPSPSPNALYEREVSVSPKFSAQVQRVPKVNTRYSKIDSATPTQVASPYGTITRGQRAGPDPNNGGPQHVTPARSSGGIKYLKRGPSPSSLPPQQVHNSVQYLQRGPTPTPIQYVSHGPSPTPSSAYYQDSGEQLLNYDEGSYVTDDNHKTLVQNFRAGPTHAALLQEQSVRQTYTPGSPTASPPARSPTPQAYFDSQNAINGDQYSPAQQYVFTDQAGNPLSQSEEIYLNQLQKQQVQISPVKSSVATYTTKYLGNTPKPDLFESTSNPGIPVGRPVQPSVGGLSYLDASSRGPGQHKVGVKEALSRLPNIKLPTTRTYEVGAPDFGSSVSYSNDDNRRKKERQLYAKNLRSNPHNLHDGILREYLVEKKLGVTPSYEDQLV